MARNDRSWGAGGVANDGANLRMPANKGVPANKAARVGDGAHIKTPPKPVSKPGK